MERTKAYEAYRRKYYAEKRIGNTKNGVRVLTINQYRRARKEGLTDKTILNAQTILSSKGQKTKVWNEYKKVKKSYNRGDKIIQEKTYFGEDFDEDEGLSYHYNLSGLLNDRDALHFIISYQIYDGEDREVVLARYGY